MAGTNWYLLPIVPEYLLFLNLQNIVQIYVRKKKKESRKVELKGTQFALCSFNL